MTNGTTVSKDITMGLCVFVRVHDLILKPLSHKDRSSIFHFWLTYLLKG